MPHWSELTGLPEAQLGGFDVAAINLACAVGLPEAPTPAQAAECLDRLDHFATCVRRYTDQRKPEFERRPAHYDHSEAKFRVVMMVSVLQKAFGVGYNRAKMAADTRHTTADVFVHGPLIGAGGTCASLPVVYVAVGRRLDYPLRLVACRQHLFFRWDAPQERCNVEVNEKGTDAPPDDYYRTGLYAITPEQEQHFCFLRSRTPRTELAGFLAQRAYLWLDVPIDQQVDSDRCPSRDRQGAGIALRSLTVAARTFATCGSITTLRDSKRLRGRVACSLRTCRIGTAWRGT